MKYRDTGVSPAFAEFLEEFFGEPPEDAAREGFSTHALVPLTEEEKAQAATMLVAELTGGNTDLRIFMGIEELRPLAAVVPLKKLLERDVLKYVPSKMVHVALALWLTEKNPESLQLITGVLKTQLPEPHTASKEWTVRSYRMDAVMALGRFRCREAIEVLKETLTDPDQFVRGQAMRYILHSYGLLPDLSTYHPLQGKIFSADDPAERRAVAAELEALIAGISPLPTLAEAARSR